MLRGASNSEKGHAVLYAVLIVPFAFLLTTIAVDISAWNATRDKLQQEADRLAFQGLGGLPNEAEVKARVAEAAQNLLASGVQATAVLPDSTRSAVEVKLEAQYKPRFGLFSSASLGNAFKIERIGVAQLVPGDFVLIVSDGASLRPPLRSAATPPTPPYTFSAWGNDFDWPASAYFSRVPDATKVSPPNVLEWSWWEDWNKPDFKRWATQSCFNPVLTPLKFAAIGISEALLRYGVNRIGFLFTPGEISTQGFRVVRHVHGEDDDRDIYPGQVGGFPRGTRTPGSWGNYLELEQFLGDKACILFSDSLLSISDRYEFPDGPRICPSTPVLAQSWSAVSAGRHRLVGDFSPCFSDYGVSLREAIYWNAAKLPIPGFSARVDIIASLRQALAELSDDRTLAREQTKRGNLAHNSLKQIFVLTDSLPSSTSPELQELLQNFQSRHIQVTVAAFLHRGFSPTEAEAFRAEVKSWQDLSQTYPKVIRTVLAEDPESLQTQFVPQFLSSALHFALRT